MEKINCYRSNNCCNSNRPGVTSCECIQCVVCVVCAVCAVCIFCIFPVFLVGAAIIALGSVTAPSLTALTTANLITVKDG